MAHSAGSLDGMERGAQVTRMSIRDTGFEEQVLFANPTVRVGSFRCRPEYTHFEDTGPIHDNLIVFPRTAVLITHDGASPIVADPCVVMFYNRTQHYRRDKLSDRGDQCDWFAFDSEAIVETWSEWDPSIQDREQPFSLTHGPADPVSYLMQRRVVEHLARESTHDPLWIEEELLAVLRRAAWNARRRERPAPARRPGTERSHRDLVEATRSLLALRFRESWSLTSIASRLHTSPYHLSRLFRRHTGQTLHAYRNQMRLRTSLDSILGGHDDLAGLALDLGYAHHSHFSQAFREAFGISPSRARGLGSVLTETSKIPTA